MLWFESFAFCMLGWPVEPRRLGQIYCYNRESRIYVCDLKASELRLRSISPSGGFVAHRAACFAPNGKSLALLETRNRDAHNSTSRLVVASQLTNESPELRVVVDVVDEPSSDQEFPGLYCGSLPQRAFLNDDEILLSTIW